MLLYHCITRYSGGGWDAWTWHTMNEGGLERNTLEFLSRIPIIIGNDCITFHRIHLFPACREYNAVALLLGGKRLKQTHSTDEKHDARFAKVLMSFE